MTGAQRGNEKDIPMPLIVLGAVAFFLLILGGVLFDGLALFWCRLATSGMLAAYFAPSAVRSIRRAWASGQGVTGKKDAHPGQGAGRRHVGNVGETVFMTLAAAVTVYIFARCCMDLPWLSSPAVANLSDVSCGVGRGTSGTVVTLTGADVNTGEDVGLVASWDNLDAYNESRDDAGPYAQVSATVEYLPNSNVVVSADFQSYGLPESVDLSGLDYSYPDLSISNDVITSLMDSSS
jgi:hypothetical protein